MIMCSDVRQVFVWFWELELASPPKWRIDLNMEFAVRPNELRNVRAGPAKKGCKRRIGHAPVNSTSFDFIFGHGACTNRRIGFRPTFFIERYD